VESSTASLEHVWHQKHPKTQKPIALVLPLLVDSWCDELRYGYSKFEYGEVIPLLWEWSCQRRDVGNMELIPMHIKPW
jgi:hypothetical protein